MNLRKWELNGGVGGRKKMKDTQDRLPQHALNVHNDPLSHTHMQLSPLRWYVLSDGYFGS